MRSFAPTPILPRAKMANPLVAELCPTNWVGSFMHSALRRGFVRSWTVGVWLALACVVDGASAGPLRDYAGYTSPLSRERPRENFSRPDKDGKIRPVSIIAEDKVEQTSLLSGSVYYIVYERDDRNPQDPWGTGIPDFMRYFRAGIDFNGAASPDLDPTAKYLYLYQVINHQRAVPPIESASIKLLVEPTEISSWGYFHGLGFGTKENEGTIRPLSATNLPDPRSYRSPAPALPLIKPLALTSVPTTRRRG